MDPNGDEKPPAKPLKAEYRRRLPHLQSYRKPISLTFNTVDRWQLPECVRDAILDHCLHDHGTRIEVHGAVVMPDHVHMVFTPLEDGEGRTYGLHEITHGIKGTSSRNVNAAPGRKGTVWQDESFDHVLRSDESVRQAVNYICRNPVRRGLGERVDDYRWLWREWIEGREDSQH